MKTIGLKRFRIVAFGTLFLLVLVSAIALFQGASPWLEERRIQSDIRHGLQRAEQAQELLRAFIDRSGFWPNSPLDAGIHPDNLASDDIIADVRIGSSALLTVEFQGSRQGLAGQTLIFSPTRTETGKIIWHCDHGTLPEPLRPASCRSRNPEIAVAPSPPPKLPDLTAKAKTTLAVAQETVARDTPNNTAKRVQQLLGDTVNATAEMRQEAGRYAILNGEFATDNRALGLPEPHRLGNDYFRRIGLQPSGGILYEFNNGIAGMDGHRFWLMPAGLPGLWRCESTLPEDHWPALCSRQIR